MLTERGRDFRPVLWAFLAWGNKHFAPEGPSVVIVDSETGAEADPVLVDRRTGRPLRRPISAPRPGPAADRADPQPSSCGSRGAQPRTATPLVESDMSTIALERSATAGTVPAQIATRPQASGGRRHRAAPSRSAPPHTAVIGGPPAALSKAPTTPMPAATSPPYRRMSPGFVARNSGRRQPTCRSRTTADPARRARFPRRARSCRRQSPTSGRRRLPGSKRNTCCNSRWSLRPRPISPPRPPELRSPAKTRSAIATWR